MKSTLFATIFVIVGRVAILPAFSAEEKRAAIEFREARAELGLPPQIEDKKIEDDVAVTPESVDQYSIAHAKPKTQTNISPQARSPPAPKLLGEISCRFHQ